MFAHFKKYSPLLITLFFCSSAAFAATFPLETPIALFSTSLASKITPTQTTMTLVSATTLDGTQLASSTYSFIIDAGTASQEFVKADCTGITCTNMQRGVSAITGTSTVATLEFLHLRGASVQITDAPYLLNINSILSGTNGGAFPNLISYVPSLTIASSSLQIPYASWVYNNFINTSETQSIGGSKTFLSALNLNSNKIINLATPTANSDAATKAYADGIAVAGAPNANATTKGIVQEATAAQIVSGNAAGSTGAELYVNPAQFNFASDTQTMISTTTQQQLGTTTLYNIPSGRRVEFDMDVASTTDNAYYMTFNVETGGAFTGTAYNDNGTLDGAASQAHGLVGFISLPSPASNLPRSFHLHLIFSNGTSTTPKMGTGELYLTSTTSGLQSTGILGFSWASSTAAIHSISISSKLNSPLTYFSTSTYMAAYVIDP